VKAELNLSVHDRVVILSLLPSEADFTTIRIVSDLKKELSFSEEEHEQLKFKPGGDGGTTWNPEAVISKSVIFGDKAQEIIRQALGRLNDDNKATEDYLNVYELFMGE
jgi:hypothetical protein